MGLRPHSRPSPAVALDAVHPALAGLVVDRRTIRRENPLEEQINEPANSRHYWRYRMHLPIEDLIAHTDFNKYIKDKIDNSGR